MAKRYLEHEGYFADAKRDQARRRLPVVARDLQALVRAFEADKAVDDWESYGLMVRLLAEQCEVVEPEKNVEPEGVAPVEVSLPAEANHKPDASEQEVREVPNRAVFDGDLSAG